MNMKAWPTEKGWLTEWAAEIKSCQEKDGQNKVVPSADLRARFLAWHNSLPEVSRCRPFSMLEIEQALKSQGRYLSPILLREGWQRKRKWNSKGQYHRYWLPGLQT
jgi:hypothetical protein